MKRQLLISLLILSFSSKAQVGDTTLFFPFDSLHPMGWRSQFIHIRRSFGVHPEIQFINSPVIGVSASIARLEEYEWSAISKGVNLGFEIDPLQEFYGPKLTVWGDLAVLLFGVNASVSTSYYFQDDQSAWFVRPEVGVGIPRLHLKYGFGFRVLGDDINGVQRHSLTLGYHITIKDKELGWRK